MEDFVIRRIKEGDFEKVVKIAVDVWSTRSEEYLLEKRYGEPVLDRRTRENRFSAGIRDRLSKRPVNALVSEVGGEVVGFIFFYFDEEAKIGTVGYNAVKEEYRNKGIGTNQVTKVLEIFRQRGMRYAKVMVWLDDQHLPARKVYEKCGFTPLINHATLARVLQAVVVL